MTVKQFLRGSHLFQGVSDEQLRLFLPISQQKTVEKGTHIFKEGEPAGFLYIVGKGRVAVEMRLERPDGSVTHLTTVASAGPGEAFGWPAIVEPHILALSAHAIERSSMVLIEGERLRELLDEHRDVGYLVMANVAKLLAQRLSQTREAFVYERDWLFEEKIRPR